jgi:hypothetical protein
MLKRKSKSSYSSPAVDNVPLDSDESMRLMMMMMMMMMEREAQLAPGRKAEK